MVTKKKRRRRKSSNGTPAYKKGTRFAKRPKKGEVLEAQPYARQAKHLVPPLRDRQDEFIKAFLEHGTISHAARAVGFDSRCVYEWQSRDAEWEDKWQAARDEVADHMEKEAYRRAVEGYEQPVFHQGGIVGYIRKYSDSLLQILLKANRPQKFRENVHSVTDVNINLQPVIRQVLDELQNNEEFVDSCRSNGKSEKDYYSGGVRQERE